MRNRTWIHGDTLNRCIGGDREVIKISSIVTIKLAHDILFIRTTSDTLQWNLKEEHRPWAEWVVIQLQRRMR